ncbi:cysteine hydrolase [Methylobacterium sp. J-076]|uniref:cysteine hydrolase n=1 Tax=Methylobacterium sp. J-076 TaxID=2836655 RepID=UPI001FBB70B3|nr:cysteine hydrolase [Methylobacterium sp. J-076]MCJ2015654.1 cysteine hydrolase [Methylobacterium sp. J-076]
MNVRFNPNLYRRPRSIPVLVLMDMQREYAVPGRPHALPGIEPALANCRRAVTHARSVGIPVAYLRWIGASTFQAGSRFARWIEGFEPQGCDALFDRDRPSAFASPAFADSAERGAVPLVLAGFSGEAACLATAIDGFHRGLEIVFLGDASASHGLADLPSDTVHHAVCEMMRAFADVTDTTSWIARTNAAIDAR